MHDGARCDWIVRRQRRIVGMSRIMGHIMGRGIGRHRRDGIVRERTCRRRIVMRDRRLPGIMAVGLMQQRVGQRVVDQIVMPSGVCA
jgi:hypothetical protein